jgi:hypothetical protein
MTMTMTMTMTIRSLALRLMCSGNAIHLVIVSQIVKFTCLICNRKLQK